MVYDTTTISVLYLKMEKTFDVFILKHSNLQISPIFVKKYFLQARLENFLSISKFEVF